MEIINTLATLFVGVGTFVLSFTIFVVSRNRERHERAEVDLAEMNATNRLCIGNPRALEIAERLFSGAEYQPEDEDSLIRKYIAFTWLNKYELRFLASKKGLIEGSYYNDITEVLLSRMLKGNPDLLDLLETRGYDRRFVNYCKHLVE